MTIGGNKKMIVKGPILIPGIPDMSGDILDEETVRRAALIIARNGVLTDVQHTLRNVGKILELYVLDTPMDWVLNIYNENIHFKHYKFFL